MIYLPIFIYLQLLDFLTTMVGFHFGAAEASPAILWLTQFGAGFAVAFSKIFAISLALVCLHLEKPYLVRIINLWYAGLVIWNLYVLLSVKTLVQSA